MTQLPLALSLEHISQLLNGARAAQAFAAPFSSNPYFVDLPIYNGGIGGAVTKSSVEIIASLYFAAKVEATYLPAVAEQLAENRYGLHLTDQGAAEALESLATEIRGDWVDRALRNQIFVRVFGIGDTDPNLGDTAVNHEFEPQFARFCISLISAARDLQGWGAPAGAAMRTAVAAQALLGSFVSKIQGNTLIVTERLARQLNLSITALNHPGLTRLFMGHSAWDVVRNVLAEDTPDLQAEVTQAQTGLRLLSWLAQTLNHVQSTNTQGLIAAIQAEPSLIGWAELWLDAAGVKPVDTLAGVA